MSSKFDHIFFEIAVFDECGVLIYYLDFKTPQTETYIYRFKEEKDFRNRMKTIFGVSKTLCDIVNKISERVTTSPKVTPYFSNFKTNKYKLSCYKSITNKFFLLSTRIDKIDYSDILLNFYKEVYIEQLTKNPLYKMNDQIRISLIDLKVKKFFKKYFKAILDNNM